MSKKIKGCTDAGKKCQEAAKRRREDEVAKLAELSCVASTAAAQRRWNAFSLALEELSAYKHYLAQRRQRRPPRLRPPVADERGLATKGEVAARREARASAREAGKAEAGAETEQPSVKAEEQPPAWPEGAIIKEEELEEEPPPEAEAQVETAAGRNQAATEEEAAAEAAEDGMKEDEDDGVEEEEEQPSEAQAATAGASLVADRDQAAQVPSPSRLKRRTRLATLREDVQELSAREAQRIRRAIALETAQQEQTFIIDAAVQQAQQSSKRRRYQLFDKDSPCRADEYKCPRCFYRNAYQRDACNKLACGNCAQPFCVECGKPASSSCACISAAWYRT